MCSTVHHPKHRSPPLGDQVDFCTRLIYKKKFSVFFKTFLFFGIGCGVYRKITQNILGRFWGAEISSAFFSLRFSSQALFHLPGERAMLLGNILTGMISILFFGREINPQNTY